MESRNGGLALIVVGTVLTFVVLAMSRDHALDVVSVIALGLTVLAPFAAGAILQLLMVHTRLSWFVAGVLGSAVAGILWYVGGVWFRSSDWQTFTLMGYLTLGVVSAMAGAALVRAVRYGDAGRSW